MTTTKKKVNRADYMFADKTGEELMKKPGDVNGLDFMIRNLTDCTVYLLDTTAQILVDNCKNTTFVIGPVKGSIFIRDCSDCRVSVACQQFRCRDLNNSVVYLTVQNDPIIESSSNLKFAPYNVAYPLQDEHVKQVGFDTSINKWDLIFDFTKDEAGKKPNFQFLDPSEFQIIHKSVEGIDAEPVLAFPYPQRYGGSIPDDANAVHEKKDDNMHAFGFNTTQEQAQKLVESNEEQEQKVVSPLKYEEEEEDFNIFQASAPSGGSNTNQQNQQQFQTSSQIPQEYQFNAQNDFASSSQGFQPFNNSSPVQMQFQTQSYPMANNDFNDGGFSVPMYSQNQDNENNFGSGGGFQPMQYGAQIEFDDDMDDEERGRVIQAENDKHDRQRNLFIKQEEETKARQDRRYIGKEALQQWANERKKQIDQRNLMNHQAQADYHQEQKRLKETTNPWERVVSNVEIGVNGYIGDADVSRMRQAMISRKTDITKTGGMKKNTF